VRFRAEELLLPEAEQGAPPSPHAREERVRRWMGAVSDVAFWDEGTVTPNLLLYSRYRSQKVLAP